MTPDALRTILENIDAEYRAAYGDVSTLTDAVKVQQATISDLEVKVYLLTGHVGALEAEIAALKAAQTPLKSKMLMGATIDKRNSSNAAERTAFEAKTGPLQCRRVFLQGAPTQTNLAAALAQDMESNHRVLSYKGDATDDVLRSIPQDGFRTWLVKWHEPENDGGTHTAAWFRAQTDAHIAQVKRLGRPDLIPAFVLMGWLERDANAATTSADWFPADKTGVVLLLDPYDPNNRLTLAQATKPTLDLWRAKGGTRWGIAETATHRTGEAGADWVRDGHAWATAEGAETLLWFHSAVGAEGPWWMDDPAVCGAWRALNVG